MSAHRAGVVPFSISWFAVAVLTLALQAISVLAQPAPEKKKDPPPPPEEVLIETKDGVELHFTFYPSTAGRNAAPVILLHDFGGSRADWRDFPALLQRELDLAVAVLDLRGHGDSTTQRIDEGNERTLSTSRLRSDDVNRMVTEDVEALKRWLIQRNNAGELNIERLGLVGAGFGGVVAAEWAQQDWAFDNLPSVKQGRDVKAVTLISPELTSHGLHSVALAEPPIRGEVGLQIVAGATNGKAARDARQVYNVVKRHYHDPPDSAPPEEVLAKKKLYLDAGYNTSLQGTKMLGEKLGLEERIARFLQLQLIERDYAWHERRGPLD